MALTATEVENKQSINGSNVFLDIKINAVGLKEMRDLYEDLKSDPNYAIIDDSIVPAIEIAGSVTGATFTATTSTDIPVTADGKYGFFYTKSDFDSATGKTLQLYPLNVQKITVSSEGVAVTPLDLPVGTDSVIILDAEYHVMQGNKTADKSDSATQINVNAVDNNGFMANRNGNRDISISGTAIYTPYSATQKQVEYAKRYTCVLRARTGIMRLEGVPVTVANFNVSDHSFTGDQTGESIVEQTLNLSLAGSVDEHDQVAEDLLFVGKQIPIGC